MYVSKGKYVRSYLHMEFPFARRGARQTSLKPLLFLRSKYEFLRGFLPDVLWAAPGRSTPHCSEICALYGTYLTASSCQPTIPTATYYHT